MPKNLRTKIFLSMTLLVMLGIGGAAIVTLIQGNSIALSEAEKSLESSRAAQETVASNRFQNLLLVNQLISSDPYFASYIAQASGADLGFGESEEVDAESIVDLLTERNESLQYQIGVGFDIAYLLDTEGSLLATTSDMEFESEYDFYADPVFEPLISELETITRYWEHGGEIYQVAGVPLASDDELVGFLLLGMETDQDYIDVVKETSSTEYALFLSSANAVTSLVGSLPADAQDNLASHLTSSMRDGSFEIDLSGQHWLATAAPLSTNSDSPIGIAVSLVSLDEALAGFNQLSQLLTLVALVAVVVAAALGYVVSIQTVKPLVKLSEAADEAAQGDYSAEFEQSDGSDEVATLTRSIGSLLSDLREKSDMEDFMENLARLQPEGGEETNSQVEKITAPKEQGATLVGFEFRELMESGRSPEELSNMFESAHRQVGIIIKRSGGTLVDSAGHRAVAFIPGKESLKVALGTIPQVISALSLSNVRPVVAVTRGKIISATIRPEGAVRDVSFGKAWVLLERLLSEGQTGYAMTTKNTVMAITTDALDLTTELVPGAVSKRQFPAISLQQLANSESFIEVDSTIKPDGTTATALEDLTNMNVDEIKTGMVLNNRYEILSEVGKGAMGIVYKTYDNELQDVIALKLMSVGLEPRMVNLLKSEIKLARRITHPNILRTFDFGEVGRLPFLSMEYVRGMTLEYVLKNSGNLPFSAVLRISKQLCHALKAAHQEGISHRDIKPANIMLDFGGTVKLMDFGLAGTTTGERAVGGTPNYAAPEQLLGKDVKESGDIYSFGVVLYELLTGQLPFSVHGSNLREMAQSRKGQTLKPARDLNPRIPETLNDLITSCLETQAPDRPTDIADVLQVLEDIRA